MVDQSCCIVGGGDHFCSWGPGYQRALRNVSNISHNYWTNNAPPNVYIGLETSRRA